jgi:hypothetical protein
MIRHIAEVFVVWSIIANFVLTVASTLLGG